MSDLRTRVLALAGSKTGSRLLVVGSFVVLAALPFYLERFWLQTGMFAMAAVVSAVGLTLLVGIAGQLSLGHAFFVAVGAYGYAYLAGGDPPPGTDGPGGAGLPPLVAAVGAVLLAGIAGIIFSPVAARVRGIYLGLASLGLVFLGQHILANATGITGGFNGRDAAPLSAFGFSFSDVDPEGFTVLGVPFGALERLWYVGLLGAAVAVWFGRNLVRSRPGRALAAVRDGEVAAGVMGVHVAHYRAAAFTVSSMYAGFGGVLTALAFGRIVPDAFDFMLSVDFLVMIVIGGIGSVGGAAVGAVLVTALPLVLNRYSGSLPLLAEPGSGGIAAPEFTRLLYGAIIVAVLLFAHDGAAGLARRVRRTLSPSRPIEVKETLTS